MWGWAVDTYGSARALLAQRTKPDSARDATAPWQVVRILARALNRRYAGTPMNHDKQSDFTVMRHGEKEAVRFVTPSGVTAIVATSVDPVLLRKLRAKLKRKLRARRQGIEGR